MIISEVRLREIVLEEVKDRMRQQLEEHGDKVSAEIRGKIESAITNVESTIKNDDVNAIRLSVDELKKIDDEMKKSIFEKMGAEAGAGEDAGPSEEPQPQEGEDVIDAEFEVKE